MQILTIDKNKKICKFIEGNLLNIGYSNKPLVHHAFNIDEALEWLQKLQFDLIIIDPLVSNQYSLPLISMAKTLFPFTKIITFSYFSQNPSFFESKKECITWGADYCLDKTMQWQEFPIVFKKILFPCIRGTFSYENN